MVKRRTGVSTLKVTQTFKRQLLTSKLFKRKKRDRKYVTAAGGWAEGGEWQEASATTADKVKKPATLACDFNICKPRVFKK